ncbi:glycosyltransferase family 1 protein [Alkalihalobacterium alkalinitrilicum]|uniref:glycosyltransferase family 1 protein n=1 Tax=Alkalihalobacterium alkalinitrilicum TaxID=427920 RepID=UPI000995D9DF|nr:glycosyltransferase family 1 protein [Alkalihalobacterium alkalinitrilicum]
MGKIKVLHVLAQRPKGGIGTFLKNMQANIDTSKVQFDYIICDSDETGEFDTFVEKFGSKVHILSPLKSNKIFRYISEVDTFFKTNGSEYDIVHGHLSSLGVIYLSIASKYGIKHRVIHSHATRLSDKRLNEFRNFFTELPLKKAANIYFACSKKAGEHKFGKKNMDNNKVHIINNAVDVNKYRFDTEKRVKLRKELNLEDKIVIGNVGRLSNQKNLLFLIDVFHRIYDKDKKAVLMLIGDGELFTTLKNKVDSLGLKNAVLFLGKRSDVDKLLQAMDVFVMTSLYEGFPLVGVEAQCSGLPCVFSNTITKEIKVTDGCEFLSLKETKELWASKILNLVRENSGRNQAYKLVANAGYDIKKEAEKLQRLYHKIMEKN